ncbi:MAG: radical family heme chaperone HemW [Bacteroidota bacterium]
MAGIYLHIPFCKQACNYCNFHFSTSMRSKGALLTAIEKELFLQQKYLNGATIETIYFGGGTPSVLSATELLRIFDIIYENYNVVSNPEITLEANPDDLSFEYLAALRATPINRLSIGVQSFSEADLRFMNRAHNAIEAKTCIEYAQDLGFDNLTIDLIYGSPTTSHAQWEANLKQIFEYDIPHVSCYALTVEPKTPLQKAIKRGEREKVSDDHAAQQFEMLMEMMQKYGYVHYEISNFAQPDHYARHNSNYWRGVSYLGIGPSAHSFDGNSRQWNVSNNAAYIKTLEQNEIPFTVEILTDNEKYNEYVMTSLRTIWGCDPRHINEKFGNKTLQHFNQSMLPFVQSKMVEIKAKKYFLTNSGRLLADKIAVDLFI